MEDVNVLLVGLPGAGSSTLFKKLLELGDQSMYMEHSVALIERDTKRFYISELPSSYTYEPGLLKWGSLADIAVLIIPGSENIDNNWETLIHTVKCVCCIKALGIPKIVVAVNKIDNLSYSSYNTHQGRGIGVCYNVHYRDEEEGFFGGGRRGDSYLSLKKNGEAIGCASQKLWTKKWAAELGHPPQIWRTCPKSGAPAPNRQRI